MHFVGTQYFRPPNPDMRDFERDLDLIAEHGIPVIRTWLYWRTVNPAPGQWDFSAYDRLFRLAGQRGLKVLVQVSIEAPPEWLAEAHPDWCLQDPAGQPIWPQISSAQQVGGYPGMCLDNPGFREAAAEALRRIVRHYADHPALFAWDAWNEIWTERCSCPATIEAFRRFLKRKYGSLPSLSRAWRVPFSSWEQARPPRHTGTYAPAMDVDEFERWRRAEWMAWRAAIIRAADPRHPVVSHYGGAFPLAADADPWLLAEPLDGWGMSCYQHSLVAAAEWFCIIASACPGKPWWLSEQTGGRVWHGLGHATRTPEHIYGMNLIALALGAQGLIFWQWRCERFGPEAPHFGLTDLDGSPTPRSRAAAELAKFVRDHAQLLAEAQPLSPRVAVVWDGRVPTFDRMDPSPGTVLTDNFRGFLRACLAAGLPCTVLRARDIAARGVPGDVRLLILPCQMFDVPGLSEMLMGFARRGGWVLAGPMFLQFDCEHMAAPCVPPEPMARALGIRRQDIIYPSGAAVQPLGGQQAAEPAFSAKCLGGLPALDGICLAEALQLAPPARPLYAWAGRIVGAEAPVGRGRVIYLGLLAGAAYFRNAGAAALPELLRALAEGAGAAAPPRVAGASCVIARRASQGLLLCLVNDRSQQAAALVADCAAVWALFPPSAPEQAGRRAWRISIPAHSAVLVLAQPESAP